MNLLLSDPAFLSVAAAVSGGGGGYDPDAAAYIARVEGASGDNQALETAVKDAINAFVVGCKADGIWTAIKGSCILSGARTLAGALQPLVGPTPTNVGGNFVQADYNRKNGLTGNGSTKAILTGRRYNDDPQNDSHLAYYATTHAGVYAMGTNDFHHIVDGRDRIKSSALSGVLTVIGNPSLRGASRASSTTVISLTNNVATPYSATSLTSTNTQQIAVFGTGTDSGTLSRYNASVISFYSSGTSINLGLLNTRVKDLMAAFAAAIP